MVFSELFRLFGSFLYLGYHHKPSVSSLNFEIWFIRLNGFGLVEFSYSHQFFEEYIDFAILSLALVMKLVK